MIQILKKRGDSIETVGGIDKDCWVCISSPLAGELDHVSHKLRIPLEFLTDPLDIDERPRIETDDNALLVIVRTPIVDTAPDDVPFSTIPLGIVITNDIIITVSSQDNPVITEFLAGKVKNFNCERRVQFLLQIFSRASLQYLRYLKEINTRYEGVEKLLHSTFNNRELLRLFDIEKSLVYFTTALRANELVMERLRRSSSFKLRPEEEDLLEDIIIDNKQAIEMANIYSNISTGMMNSFASIISNNLNYVIRLLTSVTIILMIPTLIASVYGMNVKLPFQSSPHAFAITITISITLSLVGIAIFWKKRWF